MLPTAESLQSPQLGASPAPTQTSAISFGFLQGLVQMFASSAGFLEQSLLELSQLFLWPVNLLVLALFGYALLALGAFCREAVQRRRRPGAVLFLPTDGSLSVEALELRILGELEGLRLASRIAPMLGLVATMIPLGPALIAASSGRSSEVAGGLATAFAAVIVALISASLTFAIYTVRRRWLLEELERASSGVSSPVAKA